MPENKANDRFVALSNYIATQQRWPKEMGSGNIGRLDCFLESLNSHAHHRLFHSVEGLAGGGGFFANFSDEEMKRLVPQLTDLSRLCEAVIEMYNQKGNTALKPHEARQKFTARLTHRYPKKETDKEPEATITESVGAILSKGDEILRQAIESFGTPRERMDYHPAIRDRDISFLTDTMTQIAQMAKDAKAVLPPGKPRQ